MLSAAGTIWTPGPAGIVAKVPPVQTKAAPGSENPRTWPTSFTLTRSDAPKSVKVVPDPGQKKDGPEVTVPKLVRPVEPTMPPEAFSARGVLSKPAGAGTSTMPVSADQRKARS